MTDDDLDKLERTLAAMTPGPLTIVRAVGSPHRLVYSGPVCIGQWMTEEDADGIAALVNAAPALIAEVRRLRSDVAAARAAVQNLSSITGHRRVEGTL